LSELPELFHARHQAVYGFNDLQAAIEVINLRVQAVGEVTKPARLTPRPSETPPAPHTPRREVRLDGTSLEASVYRREALAPGTCLDGPAIIVQYDTTTFVPPGYRLSVDEWLNLVGELA
jgi:N-methylhydantoinase A